jgi:hypothetical protein
VAAAPLSSLTLMTEMNEDVTWLEYGALINSTEQTAFDQFLFHQKLEN